MKTIAVHAQRWEEIIQNYFSSLPKSSTLSLEFIDWHRIYLVVGSYLNFIKFILDMGIRYHFIDSGFPLVYIFLLDLVGHLLLFRLFSKVLPFLKKLFIQALNLRSFADLNLIACACLKSTCHFASRFIVRLHCNFYVVRKACLFAQPVPGKNPEPHNQVLSLDSAWSSASSIFN